jgi:hypothetical protein
MEAVKGIRPKVKSFFLRQNRGRPGMFRPKVRFGGFVKISALYIRADNNSDRHMVREHSIIVSGMLSETADINGVILGIHLEKYL